MFIHGDRPHGLSCLPLGVLLLGGCTTSEGRSDAPAPVEHEPVVADICAGAPILAKVRPSSSGAYECEFPGLPDEWLASPLFANGSPWLEQQLASMPLPAQSPLHAYCTYEYKGGTPELAYPSFMEISAIHMDGVAAADCPSMGKQGGLDDGDVVEAWSDAFMTSVGAVDANTLAALNLGVVHTYLLDTKQASLAAFDPHAERLRLMLEDLACADDRPGCKKGIHEILVTPLRRFDGLTVAHWGFDQKDGVEGGTHGGLHHVALGIVLAVQDWRARNQDGVPQTLDRGILNLSIGVGNSGSYAAGFAPAHALADALRLAACYGLPVFTAAGNSDGPDARGNEHGLTLPAAFEELPRPTESECRSWGYIPDWDTTMFPVFGGPAQGLVTAVSGVDHADHRLTTSRSKSTTRLAAAAANAVTPSGETPMTGTSMAALVASAGASLIWSANPRVSPTALIEQLYETGRRTDLVADAGAFVGEPVHRMSLCAALDASVQKLNCSAPAPRTDANVAIGIAITRTIAEAKRRGKVVSFDAQHVSSRVLEQSPDNP
jgi:hypothetical protein